MRQQKVENIPDAGQGRSSGSAPHHQTSQNPPLTVGFFSSLLGAPSCCCSHCDRRVSRAGQAEVPRWQLLCERPSLRESGSRELREAGSNTHALSLVGERGSGAGGNYPDAGFSGIAAARLRARRCSASCPIDLNLDTNIVTDFIRGHHEDSRSDGRTWFASGNAHPSYLRCRAACDEASEDGCNGASRLCEFGRRLINCPLSNSQHLVVGNRERSTLNQRCTRSICKNMWSPSLRSTRLRAWRAHGQTRVLQQNR
jgi:hypothetical protein